MPREIPLNKRAEVARLYFEGLTYDEIAKRTGVAKGSVAAIIEDLRGGRFPQFEHVAELVNGLRDLAVGLRKEGIGPAEALLLFTLTKRLLGLGVEPAHLETWVRLCQSIPEEELPRSHIIQAAMKLVKLEREGLSYDEAIERLSSSSAELKRREENLAALRTEEAQIQARKEELLQGNRSLEAEHTRLQGVLNAMALKEKEAEDHCEDLGEEIKQRQEKVDRLEANEGELTQKVGELEEKTLVLEKEVTGKTQTLRALEEVGFSRDDLEKLRDRLTEMSERHGKEELTPRFFQYLQSYDSLLGLETVKEKLDREVESLTKQKESLNRFAEKVGLAPDEVAEGIVALKTLQRRGISPSVIISYQRVLTNAGIDPQSFQRMVEKFGGLETLLAAKDSELRSLVQEHELKGQAVKELKAEEARVKRSITALRDSGLKQIKGIASSARAEVEKLCRGFHQDITRWGDMREEMGKCQEELRFARYFVMLPLSEDALSSLVEEMGAPIVIEYLHLALAWCRRKLNIKRRPPRSIMKKYYSISEYTEVELVDIITWALLMLTEGVSDGKG